MRRCDGRGGDSSASADRSQRRRCDSSASAERSQPGDCCDNQKPAPLPGHPGRFPDGTEADDFCAEPCVLMGIWPAYKADTKQKKQTRHLPPAATAAATAVGGELDQRYKSPRMRRGNHSADAAAGPTACRNRATGVEYDHATSLAEEQTCVIELESSMIERLAILGQQADRERMLEPSIPCFALSEDRHISSEVQQLMINLGLSADDPMTRHFIDALYPSALSPAGLSSAGLSPAELSPGFSAGLSPMQSILIDSLGYSGSSARSCLSSSTSGRSPRQHFPWMSANNAFDATAHFGALQARQEKEEMDEHAESGQEPEDPCGTLEEARHLPAAAAWMAAAQQQQQHHHQQQQRGLEEAQEKRQRSFVDAEAKRPAKTAITCCLCHIAQRLCSRP